MNNEQCIANLLETMRQAIKAGDWKIDGACDPDVFMEQAEYILRSSGWVQNTIDGHWQIAIATSAVSPDKTMVQTQGRRKMTNIDTDDVPVTGLFLSLVKILHSSRIRFICESILAKDLGKQEPKNWFLRCEDLFHHEFAEQFKLAGLSLNAITFSSLMNLNLDPELGNTLFDDLPLKFAFNPWLHQGKGGIKRLRVEDQHERQGV